MTGRDEPAFPVCDPQGEVNSGMTLRDYFAAKAMQSLVADPEVLSGNRELADCAYRVADAMLEARK